MLTQNQLLFFFSALGVFNGLIISIYFFFFKKPKNLSNYFFAFLILMLVIRIGKSVFYFFNPDLSKKFLQIGLSACFLIGPALYIYLNSVINPEYKKKKSWKIHFILLIATILIVGLIYPYHIYPEHWYRFIIGKIYLIWFVYLLISGYLLKDTILNIFKKSPKTTYLEFWLLSVYFGNFIIWIAYKTTRYTSYIVGALSFSFILYLLLVLILLNKKKTAIFSPTEKYSDKKIENASALIQQLEKIMSEEKPHKNPNIKLKNIADKLNISSHLLSQLLNDNLGKSFSLFINEYRVEEAKKLIKGNHKFTLEAIGFDAGFSSKSTFYATFKKMVGETPSQFKK